MLPFEGDQNVPPHNKPLWRKDYSELKAIEEKFSAFPFSPLKAGYEFPFEKDAPTCQGPKREEGLITEEGELTPRWVCINRPHYNSLTFHQLP